ncbi:MAG: alpha/beta fold hydrolase [Paracoccaceae bacterium]
MAKITPFATVEDGVRLLRWRATPFLGRVMVLLHGLGDGADVWRPVVDAWPDGPINAIAVDFPGHGGSDFHKPSDYTVPKFADWLAKTLEREGIRDPILVGHSMGGRVALEASYSGVIDPAHVVIVDVSPDPKEGEDLDNAIQRHLEMLAAGAPSLNSFRQKVGTALPLSDRDILKQIVPALVDAAGETKLPGARMRLDLEIRNLLDAPLKVNGWAALEALGCPGTIIRGAFSSALDPETAIKMSRALRKPAGCITIQKAGHAIAFEQPAALAQAIARGLHAA